MPNIEEILYDKTGFLYSELEKEIPFWEKECMNDRDDLSIFKAQCGVNFPTNANDGIVFYGRATNGWNPNKPLKMNMLKDYSGSPFFALMKAIAEHFYSTDWNNRVAWSNICKVAPMEKNNPPAKLWYCQYRYMVDILNKELEVLSPKVVVLVTGNTAAVHWDQPLFDNSNLAHYRICDSIWLKAEDNTKNYKDCTATLYKRDGRLFIVTDRPEYRRIEPHANSIINLIETYWN